MDEFTRAYVECALWSSTDDHDEPLDQNFSADDLAPEAAARIAAACAMFQSEQAAILEAASNDVGLRVNRGGRYGGYASAGHDFWLTQNGHGAGFWDGDWGQYGGALTDAAKAFQEWGLYVGDDGLLYLA